VLIRMSDVPLPLHRLLPKVEVTQIPHGLCKQ
jgi:hypothetical protein